MNAKINANDIRSDAQPFENELAVVGENMTKQEMLTPSDGQLPLPAPTGGISRGVIR